MKQSWLIHPLLFAIAPVLFLFAYNVEEVSATDLLLPILAVIIGTLILLLFLRLITKNYNKIAIITTYFIVLFFSYGHVRWLIFHSGAKESSTINLFLVSLWGLLFLTGAFFILKSRRDFSIPTRFLNTVAIILVIISLVNIGIYQVKTFNLGPEPADEEPISLDLEDSHNLPDIYYIILDGYTREDTLKESFDYDNSEFINYLTDKGFYVASESRSNYGSTYVSMPSSLNMDYLTAEELGNGTLLLEMMRNSKVSRLLKDVGYQYIFVGGNFDIKDMGKYADVYSYKEAFGIHISQFVYGLCETTILAPFARFFSSHGVNSILYAFDFLADIPNIKEPTFVYTHIMCPHPPWFFDSNGPKEFKVFTSEPESEEVRREGYIGNLVFINKKVKALVNEILLKSDIPPVIILQGDHGIGLSEEGEMRYQHEILNAYHISTSDDQLLYESITPVNSFRIVFNLYFGTNYDLLEDESY